MVFSTEVRATELLLERRCDSGVQLPAAAFQEAFIGGIPDQRVLEGINRVRNLAPAENQFRRHQLAQGLCQPFFH
jgi:hypothetical protein